MKKLVLFFIAVILGGVSAVAQNASSSHSFVGGSMAVQYYNDRAQDLSNPGGRLIITNNSDVAITKAHIRVTVLIRWQEQSQGLPITSKKTLELCDDEFTNIPAHKTLELTRSNRGIIEGGPEKPGKTYQYNIEISNVVTEPVPFPEPQKR